MTWLKVCQLIVDGLVAVEREIRRGRAEQRRRGARAATRLDEHGEDDRAGAEAERPQRGDLAGAGGDRAVHRVERAEQARPAPSARR